MVDVMSDNDQNPIDRGLVYECRVPLRWCAQAAELTEGDARQVDDDNDKVLRYLSLLDDSHVESAEEERGLATSELKRIEFKVNLLLDLVGQLLARHADMPPKLLVRVGARSLQWLTTTPPTNGENGRLELFLNPKFPTPLVLHGRVVALNSADDAGCFVSFVYEGISPPVEALLEKLIFRQHRRSIAQSRREGGDGRQR